MQLTFHQCEISQIILSQVWHSPSQISNSVCNYHFNTNGLKFNDFFFFLFAFILCLWLTNEGISRRQRNHQSLYSLLHNLHVSQFDPLWWCWQLAYKDSWQRDTLRDSSPLLMKRSWNNFCIIKCSPLLFFNKIKDSIWSIHTSFNLRKFLEVIPSLLHVGQYSDQSRGAQIIFSARNLFM